MLTRWNIPKWKSVPLNESTYKTIVKQSTNAVIIADANGNILSWNDCAEQIFGYTEQEVLGKHVHEILPTKKLKIRADASFDKFKKNNDFGPLIGKGIHVQGLTKACKEVHVHFSPNVTKIDGETIIFTFIRDISDIISLQEKLRLQSTTDELTGILNRRAFLEHFKTAFGLAQRHQEHFSLLLFDIDYFKNINDQYGHHVGDRVIQELRITFNKLFVMRIFLVGWEVRSFTLHSPKSPNQTQWWWLSVFERVLELWLSSRNNIAYQ
ncbi:MAG: PAS domain S-box-containing protein [Shewanella psychromarinicola]